MPKVMRETWILGAISLVDMALTLWLIQAGMAREANPLMQKMLEHGVMWFILFKCFCTFLPLYLLERVGGGTHHGMVRRYLRLGIFLYVGMHVANVGGALMLAKMPM